MSRPLVCPRCAETYGLEERFCGRCGMPLVYGDMEVRDEPTELEIRARKIKPQLSEGDLVRVAGAGNQAEAEFMQGLLLEEGIPSVLRRTRGFDVPDFLAAGPRDLMVPQSGAMAAREALLQAELVSDTPPAGPNPRRVLAGLLLAVAVVAIVAWLGTDVLV